MAETKVLLRINEQTYQWIKAMAEDEGQSINQTLNDIVSKAVEEYRQKIKQKIEDIFEHWEIVQEDLKQLPDHLAEKAIEIEDVSWDNGLDITFVPMNEDDPNYEKALLIRSELRNHWIQQFYRKFGDKLELVVPLLNELWK